MGFVSQRQFEAWPASKQAAHRQHHQPLGYHPKTGDDFWLSETDRFSGTYVLGVAGSGKTSHLENMVYDDACKGHAVIFIDPHGDAVNNILNSLPPECLARTSVIDLDDEEYTFSINLFAVGKAGRNADQGEAINRILAVFSVLWPEVASQQNLPNYLTAATITLLANPGSTLVDMLDLLTDAEVRHRMLRHVTDQRTLKFWQNHDALGERQGAQVLRPLTNRLNSMLMGRPRIQGIVGQHQSSISFRRAIERHEIILVRLPVTTSEEDAKLVGTLIVAQVSAAIFSFRDLPEAERPGVSLYIDEFQNFCSPDADRLYTQARKFKARLVLSHQYRDQMPDFLQSSTSTARTKICFQLNADDAREMAQYFPAPQDDRLEEVEAHASAALLKDPGNDYGVRLFTDLYLRPLHSHAKGGKVKIEQPGVDLMKVLWVGYDKAREAKPPEVENPTPYLDQLLLDVMRTRSPHLEIPPKAVVGFANCGHGFYGAVKHLKPCPELQGDYPFPAQLVADGRWLRAPKNEREQFLHFVFCLRQVMRFLAAHPIGKKATTNSQAVAQWLSQLPRRHALVRAGDDVGLIHTHDTPPKLSGEAADERLQAIRQQTRARYCHPIAAASQPPSPSPSVVSEPLGDQGSSSDPTPGGDAASQQAMTSPADRWAEVEEP